jgi:hypothetical protein
MDDLTHLAPVARLARPRRAGELLLDRPGEVTLRRTAGLPKLRQHGTCGMISRLNLWSFGLLLREIVVGRTLWGHHAHAWVKWK